MRLSATIAASTVALALVLAGPLHAQVGPPSTGGAVGAEHARRMLGHNRRVLLIGAHPDDEDTDLITYLARGQGVATAYLSLNRGEGGQNLIGSELGEALGVLRSEELLSAGALDGGEQYFTRAYDFGYSKSLEDTWAQWPRDSILKDVVRVIRAFRPQIVVSMFSGTPSDGHGQHQAAGWAAREAFDAAADPSRFPELLTEEGLTPWRPLKLYRSARFTTASRIDTIQTGGLDPAVGKSYHQIAMASRSRHQSQDMGSIQTPGPAFTQITLLADRTGAGSALWSGIDTRLPEALTSESTPLGRLAALNRLLEAGPRAAAASVPDPVYLTQQGNLQDSIANALGLVLDAVVNHADLLPGQEIEVSVSLWNAGLRPVRARLRLQGVVTTAPGDLLTIAPGTMATVVDTVRLPTDASSEPYYLRLPRDGAMYRWGNPAERGTPFAEPLLAAVAEFDNGLAMTREVTYRWGDPAFGERRERPLVVPRIGVRLDQSMFITPAGTPEPRVISVILKQAPEDTTSGQVQLMVPEGWTAPAPQPFRLTRKGEEASFVFRLEPPAGVGAGSYDFQAVAVASDGARYTESVEIVAYPHIARRGLTRPATGTIRVTDIEVPKLRAVAYVRGAADGVPEALAALRVPVVELTPDSLARGDLSRFDAVVIGSRAYETVPAVKEFNARLLDYARAGGLLLVQYQQYEFFRGHYAPYPLHVSGLALGDVLSGLASPPGEATLRRSHDRVSDENAPVRIIDRESPVVQSPNRIGEEDWAGWVQERGLYFASEWAPEYRPVLEMHDPGEPPLEGGLLVAPVGRGTYVYTGLSFYRELPAGVPGAYRLFMNLLALAEGGTTP